MSDGHNYATPEKAHIGAIPQTVEIMRDMEMQPQPAPTKRLTALEGLDGGLDGWMTVLGAWLILFCTLGYNYSFGVYEDYYLRIFLRGHSPSSIAWMGSFQMALPFAMGPLSGRMYDAGYGRLLITIGSLLFVFSLFMFSLAHEGQYYQVFLSQGVGMGIGTGLLFTPTTAIVNLHFSRRRSLAYGTALTGISIGALIFPIVLNQLFPKHGFGPTVRVTGYIILGCLGVGLLLIRTPPRVTRDQKPVDIISFFRDTAYLWIMLSALISLIGVYFPVFYLQSYAVEHNIGKDLAFYSIPILNGVGLVGRVIAAWLADKYGIWNIQLPMTMATAATIWAILGTHDSATLVVVSCLYGIFSGAWLALSISGIVSLAQSPNEIGARVGVAYAVMSLGLLISGPVQGAILSSEFHWTRTIVFSATLVSITTIFSIIVRTIISRRKNSQRV